MPRLAVAFEFPTLHGGERSMCAVLSQPVPRDWDVVALAPPEGPLADALRELGIDVVPLQLRDEGHRAPPDWAAATLAETMRRSGADHLHANSVSLSRLSGRLAGTHSVTGHLRDIMRLSRAALVDVAANARLIAVSQATAASYRDLAPDLFAVSRGDDSQGEADDRKVDRLDDGTIAVVHNGIAPWTEPGSGRWTRDRLGVAPGVPIIATIGQISLRKGHDRAAAALRRLKANGRAFAWVIAGERFSQKPESRAFEAALADGLEAETRRLGWVPDVLPLLGIVDVLLHPARQEPFGRVLLEASERGVPVVAGEVGGNAEVVPRSLRIAGDDPDLWAAAIERVLQGASPLDAPASARFPLERAADRTWAIWREAWSRHCAQHALEE